MIASLFNTPARWRLAGLCATLAMLEAACVSQQQKSEAIIEVSKAFRTDYEAILAEKGTRTFKVNRAEAFDAIRAGLARLGFLVESQDSALGFLNVFAPAPRPLDLEEWRRAADADLPRMRELARPHLGVLAEFIQFEPEGLQVVITATILSANAGSEISLTARTREIAPPQSGMPRREYLPPSAVRHGLDKIWAAFEQELRATPKKQ